MDCGTTDGASLRSGSSGARLRAVLAGGTAAALLLAALGPADARPAHNGPHVRHEQAKKEPPPKPLQDPLIVVSIADQHLTLFDKGEAVARAPVSTGMPGHPTPTGVFSVLEKEVFHRSNIYSGAPMPYMQRITWSGVALHAGVLPGYAASHGCIRMPPDFAIKLFGLTQRGARVIVTPSEVAPVPFENAHLFTLPRPADSKTGELATPAPGVRTAESQTPAVMSDATDTAARAIAAASPPPSQPAVAPSPAVSAPADAKHDAIDDAARAAVKDAHAQATQEATGEREAAAEVANEPAEQAAADAQVASNDAPTDTLKPGEVATGTVLVKPVPVVPAQPIDVKKTFEPSGVAAAPAVDPAPAPAATPAPAPATQAVLEPYGPERPLRPGPITVFVSKKEGKVFVRKGFQQILAARVTIAHPELALGTHVFTAIAAKPDGVSFDWLEVSMPAAAPKKAEVKYVRDRRTGRIEKVATPAVVPTPTATAAEALDRIEIPPYALARISSLMSPGATLIVSDQGLGPETGLETDFIVLTR